jgi:hypothetical protein
METQANLTGNESWLLFIKSDEQVIFLIGNSLNAYWPFSVYAWEQLDGQEAYVPLFRL